MASSCATWARSGPASVDGLPELVGPDPDRRGRRAPAPAARTFRSEDGRELFDLPDAPRPGAEVEAPPRFLPEYDNVLLGHADRSRFVDADAKRAEFFTGGGLDSGTLLVDGVLAATWKLARRRGRSPTSGYRPFKRLRRADRDGIEEEAELLFGMIAAPDGERRIQDLAGARDGAWVRYPHTWPQAPAARRRKHPRWARAYT